MRQLSYSVRGRCRRHSTENQLIRDSNVASDAPHFQPSILADDDVDMVDSVEMIVMLMLGGYCRIVHVAD